MEIAVHYFKLHINDYAQATAHLSLVEDAAYTRLLRKYYADERPLPADIERLQRLVGARSREEKSAVKTVLEEFFFLDDDVFRNKRADAEIEEYRSKSLKAKESANARWMRSHSESIANAEDSLSDSNANHKPLTINHKPVEKKRRAVAPDRPLEVTDPTWQSWLEIRKQKRAPVTEAVIDIMRREAKAANVSLEEAMRECCLRGWAGYKAAWKEKTSKKDEAERFWSRLDSQSTIDMELSNGNALLPQDPVPF